MLRWWWRSATAPADLQTVQQVAARARVDRRTFERWFARLGLPSRATSWRRRASSTPPAAQDPGFTVEDVAQRLASADQTLQSTPAPTSPHPGEMRLTLAPRQALERIAQGIRPAAPGARVGS